MDKINRIRLPIDIMMTLVSIVLMGGNYLFPAASCRLSSTAAF